MASDPHTRQPTRPRRPLRPEVPGLYRGAGSGRLPTRVREQDRRPGEAPPKRGRLGLWGLWADPGPLQKRRPGRGARAEATISHGRRQRCPLPAAGGEGWVQAGVS